MKIKDVPQLKQALNDQLKSNLNKTNNTAVTIKESKYICMHLFHSISKCINANNQTILYQISLTFSCMWCIIITVRNKEEKFLHRKCKL